MDGTDRQDVRVHSNKYPQGQSGLYQGLVNRINNSGCDRELLEKMVNTAAEREQIRPDEKQKLLQMIENKFRVEETPSHDEKHAVAEKEESRRKRRHSGHHNELTVRPPNPNNRGTGPLGVKDFHHHRVGQKNRDMRLNRRG